MTIFAVFLGMLEKSATNCHRNYVVSSPPPPPSKGHHLSMQVSVASDIFSTYNCCNGVMWQVFLLFSRCIYCQL